MFSTHPSDVITLSETDRSRLQMFVPRRQESARRRTRAQVLLKLGQGWTLEAVCAAFDTCRNTAVRVRWHFQEGGVDAVLADQRQERYRQALTGPQQAHLIAVACSKVPEGHNHWTLRMLPKKAIELGFVETISPETIRALLKKTSSSPGNTGYWCLPQELSGEYVAAMEDVLVLYEMPYDERNELRATIDWQFTARPARVKLKRLYPAVEAHACSAL